MPLLLPADLSLQTQNSITPISMCHCVNVFGKAKVPELAQETLVSLTDADLDVMVIVCDQIFWSTDCIIVSCANSAGKNGLHLLSGKTSLLWKRVAKTIHWKSEKECRLVEKAPTTENSVMFLQTSIETVELFNLKIHQRCRSKNIWLVIQKIRGREYIFVIFCLWEMTESAYSHDRHIKRLLRNQMKVWTRVTNAATSFDSIL